MYPPGELNRFPACVPPLGGGECARAWRDDRSPRRSTRVPRIPRQVLLLDRPCYVCPVPRPEPLSSHSPCVLVHGADLGDYGGAQMGCILPRQEGQHVDGEGRPRSARFRPSATNQRPPKPPRVSPEMKRRRDNSISQMRKVQYFAGTMSARREKIVFKRLALPVTDSPHVQDRSSSQGVVSPP